uniref:EVA1 domain-containing protein n=2 Tax=Ficedula albicollis TaxID=59894 RepID=A0A803VYT9_FICAL
RGCPAPGCAADPQLWTVRDGFADVSHFLHFFPHSSLPGVVSGNELIPCQGQISSRPVLPAVPASRPSRCPAAHPSLCPASHPDRWPVLVAFALCLALSLHRGPHGQGPRLELGQSNVGDSERISDSEPHGQGPRLELGQSNVGGTVRGSVTVTGSGSGTGTLPQKCVHTSTGSCSSTSAWCLDPALSCSCSVLFLICPTGSGTGTLPQKCVHTSTGSCSSTSAWCLDPALSCSCSVLFLICPVPALPRSCSAPCPIPWPGTAQKAWPGATDLPDAVSRRSRIRPGPSGRTEGGRSGTAPAHLWGSSPGWSSPAQPRHEALLSGSSARSPWAHPGTALKGTEDLRGIPAPYRALLSSCPTDVEHVSSLEPLRTARHGMEGRRRDMELLSNSMAAYAHIRANPESFGLYFVLGVCFGLLLTLCLLVLRLSCRPAPRPPPRPGDLSEDDDDEEDEDEEDTVDRAASESLLQRSSSKKPPRERESDSDSSDSDDDSDTTSDLSARRHRRFERTLNMNVFTSAEELERAQRLEERERIIREIWRNGQPDILGSGTIGTLGRVHYY